MRWRNLLYFFLLFRDFLNLFCYDFFFDVILLISCRLDCNFLLLILGLSCWRWSFWLAFILDICQINYRNTLLRCFRFFFFYVLFINLILNFIILSISISLGKIINCLMWETIVLYSCLSKVISKDFNHWGCLEYNSLFSLNSYGSWFDKWVQCIWLLSFKFTRVWFPVNIAS